MTTIIKKELRAATFFMVFCALSKVKGRNIKMRDSFLKNRTGIILMLCSSIFACIGQLLWKLSTNGNWVEMIVGFGLYGIGALFMLIAYKYGSLSVLQPMLSMNYVISLILGAFLLNEKITIIKCIGVFTIIAGVVMIGGGDEE